MGGGLRFPTGMNPFTRSLSARLRSRKLKQFIAHWDALEALVIRVYRGDQATPHDEQEYARLRRWLAGRYGDLRAALEPHWRQALQGGQLATEDPFAFLFRPKQAHDFVGSWPHMQALPAAREALNRLILEMDEGE
jgi:hypothetical protein